MATKMNNKKVLPLYSSPVSSKMSSSSTSKQHNQKHKKVEVRWLQSEAELYLKQWQRRYHQLEGIDDNYHQLSHQLEEYDDWCLTAQRILDLDLELIDNKNINNINNSINTNNNTINKLVNNNNNSNNGFGLFWRREQNLIFNFDENSKSYSSAVEEEDVDEEVEDDEDIESVENICCTGSRDLKRFKALNSFVNHNHNHNENESNNEFYRNIISNKTDIIKESEDSFTLNLNKKLELLSEESSSLRPILKARLSKPRSRDRNRPRPPPIRRQVFKCEHPGCSYQSDRNFNFLRHKRTHRKSKSDIIGINDEKSDKTNPKIYNTSNSRDHNISDNEVCDEKVSFIHNSKSINEFFNNKSADKSLVS